MTPLIVGTLLALAALSFVLYPLFVSEGASVASDSPPIAQSREPGRNEAIDALREIEFDRATGKLSDSDYASLKASYTQRAINTMRASDSPVCPRCGPRPENAARYCSRCGAAITT